MTPFHGLADSWQLSLEAEGKAAKTLEGYSLGVTQLADWLTTNGHPDQVETLTPELLRKWILSMSDRSEATVHTRYKAVKRFLDWCVTEGELDVSPMHKVKPPTVHERFTPMLTPDQVRALLNTCNGSDFTSRRDLALLLFFIDTGCRVSEVVNLRMDEVDLRARQAVVTGKGSRPRIVPIGANAARALDRYLRARRKESHADSAWLWLGASGKGRLTVSGVQQLLRRRGQRIGVKLHPHMLRHGFADAWLRAGGNETDLMELAGWRSRQMVSRYAAANRSERARESHRLLSPADRLTSQA
jgi:site-specific recombinase XerD